MSTNRLAIIRRIIMVCIIIAGTVPIIFLAANATQELGEYTGVLIAVFWGYKCTTWLPRALS